MSSVITKAIEEYRQRALSKGHLFDIQLVAKSKDRFLFLGKYFKRLKENEGYAKPFFRKDTKKDKNN